MIGFILFVIAVYVVCQISAADPMFASYEKRKRLNPMFDGNKMFLPWIEQWNKYGWRGVYLRATVSLGRRG